MDTLKRILGLAQELPNDQDLGAEVRKLANRKFERTQTGRDYDSCVGCAFEEDSSMCNLSGDICGFMEVYKEIK